MSLASTLMLLSLLGLFCASSLAAPLGDSQPDQTENVDQLIEETKQLAREAGTASYVIYTYIRNELLPKELQVETSSRPPCFIQERSEQEQDLSPHTNYKQRLMENYESATNYIAYIRKVEERYNDTMNANQGCDYCTRFQDIKQKAEQFMAKLNSLVAAVNATSSDPAQEEEGSEDTADTGESNQPLPHYCSNLCPEAQVDIFERLEIFASVYMEVDLIGLMEQLRT